MEKIVYYCVTECCFDLKVKRDAFFSDMGHTSKPSPPRGRLDKSRSTPAYDLGEPEPPQPSPRRCLPIKPVITPRTTISVPTHTIAGKYI